MLFFLTTSHSWPGDCDAAGIFFVFLPQAITGFLGLVKPFRGVMKKGGAIEESGYGEGKNKSESRGVGLHPVESRLSWEGLISGESVRD